MVLDSDKELYALESQGVISGSDKPSAFASLSETFGNIFKAVAPVATSVLTAKYTAEAAKYNSQVKATTETGAPLPDNVAAAPSGFNWKHPAVIAGAVVAGVLLLVAIFRRR